MTRQEASKYAKAIRKAAKGVLVTRIGTGKKQKIGLSGDGAENIARQLVEKYGLVRAPLSGSGSSYLDEIMLDTDSERMTGGENV